MLVEKLMLFLKNLQSISTRKGVFHGNDVALKFIFKMIIIYIKQSLLPIDYEGIKIKQIPVSSSLVEGNVIAMKKATTKELSFRNASKTFRFLKYLEEFLKNSCQGFHF